MAVRIGTQVGPYEITALLGSGGFGEVYRARDSKLKRDVAIKIPPADFSSDRDRVRRFEREAEVLASLNHPNIAHIYGLEESSSGRCIVMELVEGETLQHRLARGSIPINEVLQIGKQIAEALEAAHERDVIHRDIKPANIMLTADGRVKVLDFGLAKIPEERTGNESNLPTLDTAASTPGAILGTAAYMSPEQTRGQALDKRTDIWSFGCVMYELLSGHMAFAGNTASDVIASILEREPEWTLLPAATPSEIRRLVQRCLEKDARRRMRDAGDARIAIEDTLSSPQASTAVAAAAPIASERKWHTGYLIAAIAASLIIGFIGAWNLRPARSPDAAARFVLSVPIRFSSGGFGSTIAVSPDGKYVALTAAQGTTNQLFLHSVSSGETKGLPQTEGAAQAFFSPDSRWVAFFSGGKLKKLPVDGGVPVILCEAPAPRGGFWAENGTIVFSPLARGSGIVQVAADGGTPKPVTTLDSAKGETSHRLPELLGAGNSILFAAYGATYQDVSIVAQSLQTGKREILIEGASQPHYVSSGHLLYVQPKLPGVVFAVGFDAKKLKITGTPVPLIEKVLTDRGDSAQWSLSPSGMLVYAPGGLQEGAANLVLVNRDGAAMPLGSPADRPYQSPRLSPDGNHVAVALNGIQNNLWIYDLPDHAWNRFTFEGNNGWPIWSPDGKHVTYAANRAEPWRIYSKPFDGSGNDELLLPKQSGDQQPYSWSPDGKILLFQDASPDTGQDIWTLSMDGDRRPQAFIQTRAAEVDARFSPDGHWVAYASNESGRYEVYVVPFPGPGGKRQISTDGGREPVWAHSGRELFFRSGDQMMAASVTTVPAFRTGSPQVLFQGSFRRTTTSSPAYDVTADDQHFLMIQPTQDKSSSTQLNVVLNWQAELNQRVPARP